MGVCALQEEYPYFGYEKKNAWSICTQCINGIVVTWRQTLSVPVVLAVLLSVDEQAESFQN